MLTLPPTAAECTRVSKQPWRVARLIGLTTLARYLLGRLTIQDAVDRLGNSIGVRTAVVASPFGLAAVDVDKAEDLELVRRIVEDQRASQPPSTGITAPLT